MQAVDGKPSGVRWPAFVMAGVALAAAVLLCFSPLVEHPGDMLVGPQRDGVNDLSAYFTPLQAFRQKLLKQDRQFAAWNPFSTSGRPLVGNPQSAHFYLPNWISLWGDPACVLSWLLVGHHLLAGIGTLVLCRRYGFRLSASIIGAAVFQAAPFLVAQTAEGHYNQVCLIAWVPWALVGFERLRERRRAAVPVMAGLLAVCFFCGHAQELYYLVLILSVFTVCDAVRRFRQRDRDAGKRLLVQWLLVGVTTFGLVAVDLMPIRSYLRQAIRAGSLTAEQSSVYSMGYANLAQLLNPAALGGPADYRGPGHAYWESVCHFGVVPLLLAVLGSCLAWRRPPTQRMVWLWCLAILFAIGEGPVYPLFHKLVPGVSLFRVPSRSLFFASLAVSILAAAGVDALAERALRSRLGRLRWLVLAGITGTAAMCVVELSLHARHVLRVVPSASVRVADPIKPLLGRELADGNTEQSRIIARHEHLSDLEAFQLGIQRVQGYEPVPLVPYTAAISAMSRGRDPLPVLMGVEPIDPAALHKPTVDLLGVRYLLTDLVQDTVPDGWRFAGRGSLPRLHTIRGEPPTRILCAVYENETPLPRAFAVGHVKRLQPGQQWAAALQELDARREILLDNDVLAAGPRTEFQPAHIVEYTPQRVIVEVELAQPGYLFLSDVWYPGWTATDNGKPVALLRANLAFRAVPLTAGRHRVEFSFSTRSVWPWALVTALTIGMIAVHVLSHPETDAGHDVSRQFQNSDL